MKEELGSITDHDVYTVTKIPPGVNIVSTKWVYKSEDLSLLEVQVKTGSQRFQSETRNGL